MTRNPGPAIAADPFVRWLEQQVERLERELPDPKSARHILAFRLGVSRRTLYTYLRGERRLGRSSHVRTVRDGTFPLYSVQQMLEASGHQLCDVYDDQGVEVQ